MKKLTHQIEVALCANQEMLTVLPRLFRDHGVRGEAILAALSAYQVGLQGMLCHAQKTGSVELESLTEAIGAHLEISQAVVRACDQARVPPGPRDLLVAIFAQFRGDLSRLAA